MLLGGIFSQGVVPASSLRTPFDYGAIGDGITNDTVALQKAIDATVNGGSLYFPGGYKFLVRNLSAAGEVHWIGPGGSWLSDRDVHGAVIVQGDQADGDLLTLKNAANSSISGLAFDGNKAHQVKPCNGITMINCEFTRLENVYVTSCSGNGIALENGNTAGTSDEIDLIDCYSVLNAQDGVRFVSLPPDAMWSPGDCEIIGGHYDYNSGNGIYLHVSSYTGISGANVLTNGGAGIAAMFCTGLNISGNMVRNNQHQGIVFGSGPEFTNCMNCLISGNQVHINSRAGVGKYSEIDVGYGSTNTRIIGNYCGDVHPSVNDPISAQYGIWLHDGSKHTVVLGNSCPPSELVGGGFLAESGATYTAIANTGIADTYPMAGAMKTEKLVANGGRIGTVTGAVNEPVWAGIKGNLGGTVYLPSQAALVAGESVVVKDEGGAAARNHILISGNGLKIDGSPFAKISTNYGSVRLRYDGAEWWSW